jgi:hypothetical protein
MIKTEHISFKGVNTRIGTRPRTTTERADTKFMYLLFDMGDILFCLLSMA